MNKKIVLNIDTLESALKIIDEFCDKEYKKDGENCFKIKLVYEELITNMFKYAIKRETKYVELYIKKEVDLVKMVFLYDGDEFDPTTYKDKRVNEPFSKNKKQGGLGLFLVSQFSKRFCYKRKNNINELSLEI